ncbi:6061_t:CDS:1, partial [Dentiscutata erythropus]
GELLYEKYLKSLQDNQEILQRNIALLTDKEDLVNINRQLQDKVNELEAKIE